MLLLLFHAITALVTNREFVVFILLSRYTLHSQLFSFVSTVCSRLLWWWWRRRRLMKPHARSSGICQVIAETITITKIFTFLWFPLRKFPKSIFFRSNLSAVKKTNNTCQCFVFYQQLHFIICFVFVEKRCLCCLEKLRLIHLFSTTCTEFGAFVVS